MRTLTHGSYSTDEVPEYVDVGHYASIAKDVYFHPPSDNHACIPNRKCVYTTNWGQEDSRKGHTVVGNDVWIATGAKILYGVHIGDGAIIGAWAVVAKDVPPFAVVVGNPQQIKRFRFDQETIIKLLELKWWDWPPSRIDEMKDFMNDIDVFLLKAEEYGYSKTNN